VSHDLSRSISKTLREAFDHQRLLFDLSPVAVLFADGPTSPVAQQYASQGYVICRDVPSVERAFALAMRTIAALALSEPYTSMGYGDFQLAKADRTPVCDSIVQANFQTLHFDYGLPVLSRPQQGFYGVVALYMPPETTGSFAETRIVQLRELKAETGLVRKHAIERLCDYVCAHGDGWSQPSPTNTGRIAIFLRVLEALRGENRFAALIDSDSAGFISEATQSANTDSAYLELERSLFHEFGIDLGPVERRVRLRPGDMLLLDNVSIVHGRLGKRPARELWHMLFGVPDLSPPAIHRMLNVACGAYAD
jgi:hypothetical protein